MNSVAVRGSVIAMLVLGFVSHIAVAFAGPFEDALAAYDSALALRPAHVQALNAKVQRDQR